VPDLLILRIFYYLFYYYIANIANILLHACAEELIKYQYSLPGCFLVPDLLILRIFRIAHAQQRQYKQVFPTWVSPLAKFPSIAVISPRACAVEIKNVSPTWVSPRARFASIAALSPGACAVEKISQATTL
jgi:hypothetical protein